MVADPLFAVRGGSAVSSSHEPDVGDGAKAAQKVDSRADGILTLRVLGPFSAHVGDASLLAGARKNQALLAYLARRPEGPVPRDTLCGLLWADGGEEQARASLRTALSALRKSFGPATGVLDSDTTSVRLAAELARIDATEFVNMARVTDGVESLRRATELYRGDFLEGLNGVSPEFDRWAEAERGALRSQFMSVLLRLVDALEEAGETEEAIATAQRLLAEDPLQEHVHRRLIRAYHGQRRYDAALKQYDRLCDLLAQELGVTPEPPTVELIREVRRMRSGGASPRAPEVPLEPARHTETPPAHAVPGRPSLAVLPFKALGDATDALYFGEGIAEDTIVELARSPDLLVVARHSSFQFREETTAPEEIGRKLGVRFVLGGSVRLAGERVRVTAHLVRCSDNEEMWAERYDRDLADILEIQSDIARSVAGAVVGRIIDAETAAALDRPRDNLEGYALVMRGLRHMSTPDASEFRLAIECFTRATELSPLNARAWSLLALAQIYLRWYFDVDTGVADLIPTGERAVRLDPREPRGHCALGMAHMMNRDFDRAAFHFEAGLAANPNDDLLLTEYGRFLMYDDRPEEGVQRIREGMRLNPYHPNWYWGIQGRCLHTLGRHAEARDAFLRMSEPPYYTYAYLAACCTALGDTAGAAAAHAALYKLKPDFDLETFRKVFPYRNDQTADRFWVSLVQAGLDGPPRETP
jgi:DNA-binding SARP family transcriptional activator/TolB-like protein/Flp pilus assembly protein TadD